MRERNNFLRRQAVVVVLQEIMGGTVERSVCSQRSQCAREGTRATDTSGRDAVHLRVGWARRVAETVTWLINEESQIYYLERLLASLWPNGQLASTWPARTLEQRETLKQAARTKLVSAISGLWRWRAGPRPRATLMHCGMIVSAAPRVVRGGGGAHDHQEWWPAWWAATMLAAAASGCSMCCNGAL